MELTGLAPAIIMSLLLAMYPLGIAKYLQGKKNKFLMKKQTIERIGNLYEGQYLKARRAGKYYYSLFLIKRYLFVAIVLILPGFGCH
jgi:hypothetical protein